MKLINNSKTKFITSKGEFKVGRIMEFTAEEAKTLLRKKPDGTPIYPGISTQDSLLDDVAETVKKAEVKSKADENSKAKK